MSDIKNIRILEAKTLPNGRPILNVAIKERCGFLWMKTKIRRTMLQKCERMSFWWYESGTGKSHCSSDLNMAWERNSMSPKTIIAQLRTMVEEN